MLPDRLLQTPGANSVNNIYLPTAMHYGLVQEPVHQGQGFIHPQTDDVQ
jgi:hypothetical protein